MNHGQIVSFTVGVRRNGEIVRGPINSQADIHLFGQEVNPETFAVCKSDLFMKSKKGEDAERIAHGTTLSSDRHAGSLFDYLIANPLTERTGSETRTTSGPRVTAVPQAVSAPACRGSATDSFFSSFTCRLT